MPFKIVNRNTYKGQSGIYIGRGSVWGNPYTHLPLNNTQAKFQVPSRDAAVELYRNYSREKYETDMFYKLCMDAIARDHLRGKEVVLVCHCAPKRCHGEIIAEFAEALAEFGVVSLADDDAAWD